MFTKKEELDDAVVTLLLSVAEHKGISKLKATARIIARRVKYSETYDFLNEVIFSGAPLALVENKRAESGS